MEFALYPDLPLLFKCRPCRVLMWFFFFFFSKEYWIFTRSSSSEGFGARFLVQCPAITNLAATRICNITVLRLQWHPSIPKWRVANAWFGVVKTPVISDMVEKIFLQKLVRHMPRKCEWDSRPDRIPSNTGVKGIRRTLRCQIPVRVSYSFSFVCLFPVWNTVRHGTGTPKCNWPSFGGEGFIEVSLPFDDWRGFVKQLFMLKGIVKKGRSEIFFDIQYANILFSACCNQQKTQ